MKSSYKRAIATLCFCTLFCIHPATNAEEVKLNISAQSSVAGQGAQEQSKDAAAKPAKSDEAKKKSSTEAEPECNN